MRKLFRGTQCMSSEASPLQTHHPLSDISDKPSKPLVSKPTAMSERRPTKFFPGSRSPLGARIGGILNSDTPPIPSPREGRRLPGENS